MMIVWRITVTFWYTIGINIPYTSSKRENKDLKIKRIGILVREKIEKSNHNPERLNKSWEYEMSRSLVCVLSIFVEWVGESFGFSFFRSSLFPFSILYFGICVTIIMYIIAITTSAPFWHFLSTQRQWHEKYSIVIHKFFQTISIETDYPIQQFQS